MNESDPTWLGRSALELLAQGSAGGVTPPTAAPARRERVDIDSSDSQFLVNSIGSGTDLKTFFRLLIRQTFLRLNEFHTRCGTGNDAMRLRELVSELVELARLDFFLADRLHPPDASLRSDNKSCLRELVDLLKHLENGEPPPAQEMEHSMDNLIVQLVRVCAMGVSYVGGGAKEFAGFGDRAPAKPAAARPGRQPASPGGRRARQVAQRDRGGSSGEEGLDPIDPGPAGPIRTHAAGN